MKKIFLFLIIGVMTSFGLQAQTGSVSGKVKNDELGQVMEHVQVQLLGTNKFVFTNANGEFKITEVPAGKHLIELNQDGFSSLSVAVSVTEGKNTSMGTLVMEVNELLQSLDELDVNSIADQELDVEVSDLNSSGVLHSSKDPFNAASAYTFSAARFRRRGYGTEQTGLFFNGIPMNDMENGRAYWFLWGGLNDVTRDQTITEGLNPIDNGFGGFGGSVNINTKASDYRVGTKVVYSASNRSYRNRLMLTHSTGLMDNGWAFTASVSKRWAEEGYIDGTSYDAYGYFLSALKKINDKHSIGLTVFGAPSERGGRSASTQEANDLVGDNFYNPNWGWQDGKKRNARMSKSHKPVSILKHYWDINDKSKLTTSVAYIFGDYGRTALNWVNAPDPRPDYYRNLPSYSGNLYNPNAKEDFIKNSQIDWDKMYEANKYNNPSGDARYFVEDRRNDVNQIVADVNFKHEFTDNLEMVLGANYSSYKGHNYTLVDDLLGAQYVTNIDKFADRRDPENPYSEAEFERRKQHDLDYYEAHGEAQKLKEGDNYGHNYYSHVDKASAFGQVTYSYNQFDFYGSLGVSHTTMWRDSKKRKGGEFENNSFGESEKVKFFDYGVKGGVRYKLNGKNFFTANAGYLTKAPTYRSLFLSPRTNHLTLKDKGADESLKILSGDIGYEYRSPNFKLKANAYYTLFQDGVKTLSLYYDDEKTFVNQIQTGVDRKHMGIEVGFDYKLMDELSLIGAVAIGEYTYNSRPLLSMYADNGVKKGLLEDETVYVKGFKVSGTPQQAYTAGLKYSSSKYWWAGVNANLYREMYLDYNPLRRTYDVYEAVSNDPVAYQKVFAQSKLDDQFTLDFNIGKSWRIDYKYYINVNLSVNNVLDNTDFVTGGYEQSRVVTTESAEELVQSIGNYTPKQYYAYGRNFFLNVSFRF